MKHEAFGYSVVFTKGTRFFALAAEGVAGRAFFQRHRDAVALKRDLAEHKLPPMKVVRVRVRMETVA